MFHGNFYTFFPFNLNTRRICWSITDNEGKIIFPTFAIAPGETIYVTRNATAFAEQISNVSRKTISPDFEYGTDSNPDVTQLQTEGRFALRNSGDEVLLQDSITQQW